MLIFQSNKSRCQLPFVSFYSLLFNSPDALLHSQQGEVPGQDLLKLPPRPKRAERSPARLPLEWMVGERIAFVGNSTGEKMNVYVTSNPQ